jgi:hypothetical protein
MKKNSVKSLPGLVILVLLSLMLISCESNSAPLSDGISNSDLIAFKDFSLSAHSVNLNTSIQGTIFVEGDVQKPGDRHITICARVEIDPQDWGGVGLYIEQTEWDVTNFNSDYPQGSKEPDRWATIWTKAVEPQGFEKWITIGRSDNPPDTSGGGVGTIVIELSPVSGIETLPETLEVTISIGSKDGYILHQVGEDVSVPINVDYQGSSSVRNRISE